MPEKEEIVFNSGLLAEPEDPYVALMGTADYGAVDLSASTRSMIRSARSTASA